LNCSRSMSACRPGSSSGPGQYSSR
jgi:hypothetical protein